MTDPTPPSRPGRHAPVRPPAAAPPLHLDLPGRQVLSKIPRHRRAPDIEQQIRLERAAEISEQPAAAPGPERLAASSPSITPTPTRPRARSHRLDRAAEAKRAELRALGEVLTRTPVSLSQGIAPREWRKLCDENPPRDDNRRDAAVGAGTSTPRCC